MADVKISALPAATTPLAGTEVLPIVQGGVTEQVSVANLTAGRTVAAATVNVDANSASAAVRITQTGAGNALLVEDSANPDSTPFVIDTAGYVLVGQTATTTYPNYLGTSITPNQQATSSAAGGGSLALRNTGTSAVNPAIIVLAKERGAGTPTILSNGDDIGAVTFDGYDGAAYAVAANILGEVDAAPGAGSMPGRLVFSTTASSASTPTERMRITSSGGVSIGTSSASAATTLRLSKDVTGAVTSYGVLSNGAIQSDVTTAAQIFVSNTSVADAAFTLAGLSHFFANPGTKGASATVTNQYGFNASSALTAATNNYGFYGNIASGANRWNFYAAGTAANAFSGDVTIFGAGGLGYSTGSGGAVTQTTSRTTGVTLNKTNGAITLVSAAGSTSWQTFTVTNSTVAATDTIIINQKSGTDLNEIHITAVAAGSFNVSFRTTGGTTTEQPVFNFAVIKAVAA